MTKDDRKVQQDEYRDGVTSAVIADTARQIILSPHESTAAKILARMALAKHERKHGA